MCDWITEKSEKLEMDDLAKDLDVVKLQSAAKPQRPGEDCMAISPRH